MQSCGQVMLRRLLPLKLGPVESLYANGGMHVRGFLQYLDADFNEALDRVTIPIRYGVNILEWNWDERVSYNDYCYGADTVAVGAESTKDITFFALEWINPRLGKAIREVRLKGTTGFRGGSDRYDNEWSPVIESNAVILKAISMVQKRTYNNQPKKIYPDRGV